MVRKELEELPRDVIDQITEASLEDIDTREFLGKFKVRKKKLTHDIARHFYNVSGKDAAKAQQLIDKWNYVE